MAGYQGHMMAEIKSASEEGNFEGVLSTYGNIDAAGDVCEPGCFDKTVAEDGPRRPFLWQHDQSEPIGHLEITDTQSALMVKGKINLDTQRGREGWSLLKNGDINGLSIGYITRDYSYDENGVRHLLDVQLLEGSLVSVPCNNLARAQAKSRRLSMMSRFAECKFLSLLSPEQRDKALAELDEIWESKACGDGPDEKKAGMEDDEPDMDDDSSEGNDPDDGKDPEEKENNPADEAEDEDEMKMTIRKMADDLDTILSKLEA